MEALLKKIQKIKKLNISDVLAQIFSDFEFQKWLLDLIRYEQLYKEGVNEENVIIGRYAPYTKALKDAQGVISSHITLRDTGAFYNSMYVLVNKDNIIINAEGEKIDPITGEVTNLFEVYGQGGNLLGLTEENWVILLDKITPLIIKEYANI